MSQAFKVSGTITVCDDGKVKVRLRGAHTKPPQLREDLSAIVAEVAKALEGESTAEKARAIAHKTGRSFEASRSLYKRWRVGHAI